VRAFLEGQKESRDRSGAVNSRWSLAGRVFLMVLAAGALGFEGGAAQTSPTPHLASAPTTPEPSLVRVGLGLGVGSMGSSGSGGSGGIALRGGVALPVRTGYSLTVRSTLVEELNLWGPSPAESVWDLGVLYGPQTRGKWGYATVSLGVALVGGTRRGDRLSPPVQCPGYGLEALGCALAAAFSTVDYEERRFHTVGIPLEVEAGVTLFRGFGLGVSAFANVNPERSLTGLTLSVLLGRLR
jgi:hypothetical protein